MGGRGWRRRLESSQPLKRRSLGDRWHRLREAVYRGRLFAADQHGHERAAALAEDPHLVLADPMVYGRRVLMPAHRAGEILKDELERVVRLERRGIRNLWQGAPSLSHRRFEPVPSVVRVRRIEHAPRVRRRIVNSSGERPEAHIGGVEDAHRHGGTRANRTSSFAGSGIKHQWSHLGPSFCRCVYRSTISFYDKKMLLFHSDDR